MKGKADARRSKHPTSFKLSTDAITILSELSTSTGNSKTAVLERLLREEKVRQRRRK